MFLCAGKHKFHCFLNNHPADNIRHPYNSFLVLNKSNNHYSFFLLQILEQKKEKVQPPMKPREFFSLNTSKHTPDLKLQTDLCLNYTPLLKICQDLEKKNLYFFTHFGS